MSESWKQFDPDLLSPGEMYGLMIRAITPRPIAWVSSCSESGILNLAPFSFFNGVCSQPPAIMFSPVNRPDGTRKDTVINIEATRQFVVNIVPDRLSKTMHQTSAEYPPQVSEIEAVGLETIASIKVRPPRIALSPIQLECELIQIVQVGDGPLAANMIIGKILMVHASRDSLDQRGKIDPDKVDTIGRMGGRWYANTRERFELEPPTI